MNANSGGAFATSQRNDAMVEQTRRYAADFLNVPSADEIVFGPNMTSLTFALSRALGQALSPGDEIVLTRIDHVDVQEIGCDFLLCSVYKFFGPHIGLLWGRYDLLASLPAYKVRPSKDKPPHCWETGTASFEIIAGVGAALEYLAWVGREFGAAYANDFPGLSDNCLQLKQGMAAVCAYEQELVTHLLAMLQSISGVHIAGITDADQFAQRVPTVVFVHQQHTPRAIANHLAAQHIYVWDGDYYAVEIMKH